jgi:hypothetical protein
VNLAGFGMESAGTTVGIAEHLDLRGVLEPGGSKTFFGGPGATDAGWIGASGLVFGGAGDFASLVWEHVPLSTAFCDGRLVNSGPPNLAADGEGQIIIDVVVPYGLETQVPLVAGWNLVPTGEGTVTISTAFSEFKDMVDAVYVWDSTLGEWSHWIPDAPAGVNNVDTVGAGNYMWVLVNAPFTLTLPK